MFDETKMLRCYWVLRIPIWGEIIILHFFCFLTWSIQLGSLSLKLVLLEHLVLLPATPQK